MGFKRLLEYVFLWLVGGSLYYTLEKLFRGFSHWSMFVLGGICMMFFAFQGRAYGWGDALWRQIIRCAIFITSCEFITGLIVNKYFHWSVWDYSSMPLQLFGQICFPFAILFALLSIGGILLSGNLLHWIFKEEKPRYNIF